MFEPEYVGTFGHKLTGIVDINTFDGRIAGASAGASTRINPNIGADNFRTNAFSSNYHSLQMSVRKNYSSGVTFTANYTYSKALDQLSDAFNSRTGTNPMDNMNVHYDYGPADFDLRHRIVAQIGYDLPFMKSNRWIGGWGMNSIISYQTGHPFTPYSSSSHYDANKDGHNEDRLVPSKPPNDTVLSSSPGIGYFDTSAWSRYTCPASVNGGLWCDPPIGRNSLFGPHFANVDFNVSKKFKITERAALTFQANFFDLFNHPNFLTPCSLGAGAGCNDTSGVFGASGATTGDSGGHRVVQLALRLDF